MTNVNAYKKLTFKINFYIQNNILTDCHGNHLLPGADGIVTINVDGKVKRFVYEKLLSFLSRNGVKNKVKKPAVVKKKRGEQRRKPVIVTTPENKELIFESSADAARSLSLCRTNIPHVLSGKYRHISGHKIRYA